MTELRWLTLYRPRSVVLEALVVPGEWTAKDVGEFFCNPSVPTMSMEEIRELSRSDPHPYEGWTVDRVALPWVVWRGA